MIEHQLNDQEIVRREEVKELRAMGIEPWPAERFDVSTSAAQILEQFETNPEARERYLAQRRESDRQRRARQGSKPRPNGRIENNGLDRRPKGEQC